MNKPILIAYFCYIALGTFDGLLGVIWPAMSADLGVPLGSLGILLLVALVGFVLVSFNNGPLTRRLTFHTFLLTSLIVRAVGFALLAAYPSWPMAIAMIFVVSLGGAGIDSGLNTFLSERGTTRQLNWLHASFGIGATLGPSWRRACWPRAGRGIGTLSLWPRRWLAWRRWCGAPRRFGN